MGSRNGWPRELAERCEAVDWDVTIAKSGHYRVKTHDGRSFSFPCTPGDYRAMKNAERYANRYGLDQREEEFKLRNEKERLERIERDRAQGVDWDAEERRIEEEQMKDQKVLGYVNGLGIIDRVTARAVHPRSIGNEAVPIEHGMELLMEDESVIFQCVYPMTLNDIEQDCGRTFETGNSLRSHISWHVRKAQKRTNETVVEAQAELTGPKPEGGYPETVEHKIENLQEGKSITVKYDVKVVTPGIITRLAELGDEIDELVDEATELTESIRVKRNEFRKLVAELPQHLANEQLRDKARKYDEITKITS